MKLAPRHWRKKLGDTNVAVALFSLALITYIWIAAIAEQRAEREEAIAAAIRQNSNLVVAYEEHMIRTLNAFDAITRFVRHEYQRLGTRMDLAKYISDGVIDSTLFSILSIVDERGDIVLSSTRVPPVNYADRDHFKAHVDRSVDALYISRPVLGRVSGTWQIPMTRRIDKPGGAYGGTVLISVDPAYFTRFYQKADLGSQGLVGLSGLDGIARARRVGRDLSFGDYVSTGLLQEQARSPAGSFLDPGKLDGVRRYVSYRTLADYPLIVSVGTAEDEILALHAKKQLRAYRTALLVSAVIAIFAVLLMLAVSRQKHAAAALAADINERKRLETELRELAATDMLTGLPNRRHFLERLEDEHARLKRFDALHAAVLMLDLDYFKRINDTYGHASGDEVLRHFSNLIRDEIRQIDTGSRVGGEEFAIILPGATPAAAHEFAERLRRKVADSVMVHDAQAIRVTVSIGISAMNANDSSAEAALARADEALYRAKAAGRNRVEVAFEGDPMDHAAPAP